MKIYPQFSIEMNYESVEKYPVTNDLLDSCVNFVWHDCLAQANTNFLVLRNDKAENDSAFLQMIGTGGLVIVEIQFCKNEEDPQIFRQIVETKKEAQMLFADYLEEKQMDLSTWEDVSKEIFE